MGYSLWGRKEADRTERLTLSKFVFFFGKMVDLHEFLVPACQRYTA